MCTPPRIPLPVTILYVVTVTNLVVLLNLTLVDANVRVLNRFNQTIVDSIMDLPAKFGAPVPDEGIWGHLIYAEPKDACSEIKPPPKITSNQSGIPNKWIALVRRSNCNFDWKVIQAQKQGYIAVIIHNVGSDQLVPMRGSGNQSKVVIPSIFIGYRDAEYLYEKCNDDIHYTIVIDTESPIIDPNTAKLIFSIFGIVIGSCFLTMIVFAVVKWVRDYRRRSRSRLSKANLKQLPVQKFKKGDVYDICAICLDEYEEGEKLRILPCNHAYHMKCIDPWLLKNKKTCPICKRKVMPSRNHSDSESDSDDDSDNEGTSESEPLLSANRFPSTRGNTFNNTGVPDRLLQQYNFSSSDDEEDMSSTEDSLRPLTSRYQSSVEVHSEPDYRTARAMRPPRRIGDLSARYAMFTGNTSDEVDNPAKTANQEEAEPSGAQASTSAKPETKPKEKRAWEYGLSPPKADHFSIYDETTKEDIAEEEEPVAIEMSPSSSQEEEQENNTSGSGRKGAEGDVVVVNKGNTKGKKAAGLSREKKPSGTILDPRGSSPGHDDGNARGCANGTAETGTKRKMMKTQRSPQVSGSEQQNGSLRKTGKRIAATGGVISPMEGGNDNSHDMVTNVEDLNRASDNGGLSHEVGRGMDSGNSNNGEVDHVQRLQPDQNNLELQGAVGGAEEDSCLLEQPTVEVVSSDRRKNKKKLPKKKR